jgi:hypothetical protein
MKIETRAKISAALMGNRNAVGNQSSVGNRNALSHGMTNTPTYRSWAHMVQRCTNSNYDRYPFYGGRGITVCDRWRTFANFLADMGERPEGFTLDRVDNEGNYTPENCRWATSSQQQRNRRPWSKRKASECLRS